ncbi:hypothetical protein [Ferruginibacter sp.]
MRYLKPDFLCRYNKCFAFKREAGNISRWIKTKRKTEKHTLIIISFLFFFSENSISQCREINKREIEKQFKNEQYSPRDSMNYVVGLDCDMYEGAIKIVILSSCFNDSSNNLSIRGKIINSNAGHKSTNSKKTRICVCENIDIVKDEELLKSIRAWRPESDTLKILTQLYETDDKGNFDISVNVSEIEKIYFFNKYLVCGSLNVSKISLSKP